MLRHQNYLYLYLIKSGNSWHNPGLVFITLIIFRNRVTHQHLLVLSASKSDAGTLNLVLQSLTPTGAPSASKCAAKGRDKTWERAPIAITLPEIM